MAELGGEASEDEDEEDEEDEEEFAGIGSSDDEEGLDSEQEKEVEKIEGLDEDDESEEEKEKAAEAEEEEDNWLGLGKVSDDEKEDDEDQDDGSEEESGSEEEEEDEEKGAVKGEKTRSLKRDRKRKLNSFLFVLVSQVQLLLSPHSPTWKMTTATCPRKMLPLLKMFNPLNLHSQNPSSPLTATPPQHRKNPSLSTRFLTRHFPDNSSSRSVP